MCVLFMLLGGFVIEGLLMLLEVDEMDMGNCDE